MKLWGSDTTYFQCVTNGESKMGLIELVVTVCALSQPGQCEDQHLSFSADMSLNQCVMSAQPYIAQWINEHPKWVAVRWRCDYGGSEEKGQSVVEGHEAGRGLKHKATGHADQRRLHQACLGPCWKIGLGALANAGCGAQNARPCR